MTPPAPAPDLVITSWLNSEPLTLESVRGKVVVLEAFQMLCPACVTHSLPQAQRLQRAYPRDEVAVIGVHTVFEHHEVMGPDALATFLSEFRITFPVGIDLHDDPNDRIPATMRAYALRGTPSTVLIDRIGRIRSSTFSAIEDLQLGTAIGRLLAERYDTGDTSGTETHDGTQAS